MGSGLFEGATLSDTRASVLAKEPERDRFPEQVEPLLRWLPGKESGTQTRRYRRCKTPPPGSPGKRSTPSTRHARYSGLLAAMVARSSCNAVSSTASCHYSMRVLEFPEDAEPEFVQHYREMEARISAAGASVTEQPTSLDRPPQNPADLKATCRRWTDYALLPPAHYPAVSARRARVDVDLLDLPAARIPRGSGAAGTRLHFPAAHHDRIRMGT